MERQGSSKIKETYYVLTEACEKLGVKKEFVLRCIRAHWIYPAVPEMSQFDEEDLARIQLIRDLQEDFGANDESIPIILHLLDQLYRLKIQIQKGLH